jgi:hypothetical protein
MSVITELHRGGLGPPAPLSHGRKKERKKTLLYSGGKWRLGRY